jgi:hypothetical protein
MSLVLGFSPFIVFAVLMRLSVSLALWAAFAAAFAISIRDFVETQTLKTLDTGSLALFGLLAFYTGFIQPSLSIGWLRLIVDAGMLVIVLGSVALRRPFTLQYSSAETPAGCWDARLFRRTNYIVAWVWGTAFLVMAAADAALAFVPSFPIMAAVATGLGALGVALVFTLRYPLRVQRRMHKRQAERS